MPKIKNILIFVAIAAVFVLIYIFYIKKSPDDVAPLVSSSGNPVASDTVAKNANGNKTLDFLNLQLNVKNIKLDDAIFSDEAFISLCDSSITLVADGNEGRINPFAPLEDGVVPPTLTFDTCDKLPEND